VKIAVIFIPLTYSSSSIRNQKCLNEPINNLTAKNRATLLPPIFND